MFLVDLEQGRILDDHELKHALASAQPYGQWLSENMVPLAELPPAPLVPGPDHDTLLQRQMVFGFTIEDLKYIIGPMGSDGEEAIGSMGTDTPLAVLSDRAQPLFHYFKQLFAQVTNPPLDAIREELVTSVFTGAGGEGNLLAPSQECCRQIALELPIVDNDELARLKQLSDWRGFTAVTLPMLFPVADGASGLETALRSLIDRACAAIEQGANLVVLSDRGVSADMAPIPSLLACSGLHHQMVRRGLRSRAGLLIECGDAREVHHFALLLGYGAGTINPYLAFETLDDMIRQGQITGIDHVQAVYRYRKAIKKGVVKVMSKMGISAIQCYRGARSSRRSGSMKSSSGITSTRPRRGSAASASWRSPAKRSTITTAPFRAVMRGRHGCSREVSTSGAATASITFSTPRPSSVSSTPRRPAGTTSSRNTPGRSTTRTSGSARSGACSRSGPIRQSQCPSRRSSRSSRSSSGLQPAP